MKDYVRKIPRPTKVSIDDYVKKRLPPGRFLTAVLSNNLKEAVFYASDENLAALKEIVQYCYWEIPSMCWGDRNAVRDWLRGGEAVKRIAAEWEPDME